MTQTFAILSVSPKYDNAFEVDGFTHLRLRAKLSVCRKIQNINLLNHFKPDKTLRNFVFNNIRPFFP